MEYFIDINPFLPLPKNKKRFTVSRVDIAGSGSDYRGFMHNLGVPVLDICYTYDPVSPWCYVASLLRLCEARPD